MSLFFKALPVLWSQTFPVHEFFPNLPSPAPFSITTVCWPTPLCSLPHPSNCRPIMILFHALCTFTSYSLLLSATPRTWGLLLLQMILPCLNVFSWFLHFFIISPGMWLGSTMPLSSFLTTLCCSFHLGLFSALDTLCSFSTLTCVILSVFLVSGERHLQPLLQIGFSTQFPLILAGICTSHTLCPRQQLSESNVKNGTGSE